MNMFTSPLYNKNESVSKNLEALFVGFGEMARTLNKERASNTENVVFANGTSSGSVTVPLETARYKLLIAVIAGVPVLCALHDGVLNGYSTNAHISGTVAKMTLEYSASGALDALIAIL